MKVKEVPAAWIHGWGLRLDTTPYMGGAVEARFAIEALQGKTQLLCEVTAGGLSGIVNAGRIKRQWVQDPRFGIPFLSSTDILRADLSNCGLISNRAVASNPNLIIRKGWTLITRAGTVGRMAYARPDMDGMACTEDVLRVTPDEDRIAPGYLYAFLSSRFGVPMVTSGTYGAIIQHIEPEHIADLLVPRLGQTVEGKVHLLVDEAASMLAAYQASVEEATRDFFTAVSLADLTPAEWHSGGPDVGFAAPFPRTDTFRALNFNPRFHRICEAVKSRNWLPLERVCEPGTLQRGGRYKRIDASPEHAHRLVGQRHLFWLQPEGRWIAKSALGPDVFVPPGTCLIAAQGTLGEGELYCRAEFAWGPRLEDAYSEHLLRVIANEDIILRGCLFAFIRSEMAFRMLRSISVGTKLQDHHQSLRASLPVPIPDTSDQIRIHTKVVEAYDKRHRAVAMINEAVALVESAIGEAA